MPGKTYGSECQWESLVQTNSTIRNNAQGEALRVYTRVWQDEMQHALAQHDSSDARRLSACHSYSGGTPTGASRWVLPQRPRSAW